MEHETGRGKSCARYKLIYVRSYMYTGFHKNWTLCYFIVSLRWHLRIAWNFPEVHRRYCL